MTKRAKLLAYMVAGDWRKALSLANSFHDLGAHAAAIRGGHEAMQRPDFQRQIGRDPDAAIAAGVAALQARYGDGA
jgi:hypothetical protein